MNQRLSKPSSCYLPRIVSPPPPPPPPPQTVGIILVMGSANERRHLSLVEAIHRMIPPVFWIFIVVPNVTPLASLISRTSKVYTTTRLYCKLAPWPRSTRQMYGVSPNEWTARWNNSELFIIRTLVVSHREFTKPDTLIYAWKSNAYMLEEFDFIYYV